MLESVKSKRIYWYDLTVLNCDWFLPPATYRCFILKRLDFQNKILRVTCIEISALFTFQLTRSVNSCGVVWWIKNGGDLATSQKKHQCYISVIYYHFLQELSE